MDSRIQCFRNLYDAVFSHPIRDQICPRIQQNGAFQAVRPVIIVGESAKTRLDPANDDRGMLVGAADQVAVDDRSIVRAFSHHTARCVSIFLSSFPGNRIMVDHGIHVSGRHQKSKTRLP